MKGERADNLNNPTTEGPVAGKGKGKEAKIFEPSVGADALDAAKADKYANEAKTYTEALEAYRKLEVSGAGAKELDKAQKAVSQASTALYERKAELGL